MKEKIFSLTKKDFEVQTFRSGGKGGQNQNKRDTGVRIIHRPSGAVGESREERTQGPNKKLAFAKLTRSFKFRIWLNKKIFDLTHDEKETKRQIDNDMKPDNLKVEYKEDGKWVESKKDK